MLCFLYTKLRLQFTKYINCGKDLINKVVAPGYAESNTYKLKLYTKLLFYPLHSAYTNAG